MVENTMQPKSVLIDYRENGGKACAIPFWQTLHGHNVFWFLHHPPVDPTVRWKEYKNVEVRSVVSTKALVLWKVNQTTQSRYILPTLIFKAGGKSVNLSFNDYISFTLW